MLKSPGGPISAQINLSSHHSSTTHRRAVSMAGKQLSGEGLSANLAGMSKNQLYDIMSQMKSLIEQNQHQARQILIQNPTLTKALFQAQIMLGMVQPPPPVPKVQPTVSQSSQQPVQLTQHPNIQPAPFKPGQGGPHDQASVSQNQIPPRKLQNQSPLPISSAAIPSASHQSPMPVHSLQAPQQPKGHLAPQVPHVSLPQSSQLPNVPPPSLHSSSQPHQTQIPNVSTQLQQQLQAPAFSHMPLQPPMQSQPRPSSGPNFHHQYPPQMGANVGFPHPSGPHNLPQPMFHPGAKPASVGPPFPQGLTPGPSQPATQAPYQVGGAGNVLPVDRGSSRIPGISENMAQLSGPLGPPSLIPGQMGIGNPSVRPPLTPEVEKALLQQVMSLTPDQINLLPPEQRNQVLQLQQMLRQ